MRTRINRYADDADETDERGFYKAESLRLHSVGQRPTSPERVQLNINLYLALSGLRNGDAYYVGRCPTLYNASLSGLRFICSVQAPFSVQADL